MTGERSRVEFKKTERDKRQIPNEGTDEIKIELRREAPLDKRQTPNEETDEIKTRYRRERNCHGFAGGKLQR